MTSIFTDKDGWAWFVEMKAEARTRELEVYSYPHTEGDQELIVFTPEELAAQKEVWMRKAYKFGGANICAIMIGGEDKEDAFEIWFKELDEK